MIAAECNVRVDFCGAWTDEAPYNAAEGGAVVNLGIHVVTTPTVRVFADIVNEQCITFVSLDRSVSETITRIEEVGQTLGPLRLLKIVANRFGQCLADLWEGGQGIVLTSQCLAPFGAGLGQSGALTLALVAVFQQLRDGKVDRMAAAQEAFELESSCLGGGWQDQFAAAFGGTNFISTERGMQRPVVSSLLLDEQISEELQQRLVIVYTGSSHVAGEIGAAVFAGVAHDTVKWDALRQMKRLAFEARDAILSGKLDWLAELLSSHWQWEKVLAGPQITNQRIDDLFLEVYRAGAQGGRLGGAGGGGCMVLLAKSGQEQRLKNRLAEILGQDAVLPFVIGRGLQVTIR